MKLLLSFIFCLFIGFSTYAQSEVNSDNPSVIGEKLKIYPNPCYGDFNIQAHTDNSTGNVELYVLNILGQRVYFEKIEVDKSGNIQREINVSNLPRGLYFVELNDGSAAKHDIVKLRID